MVAWKMMVTVTGMVWLEEEEGRHNENHLRNFSPLPALLPWRAFWRQVVGLLGGKPTKPTLTANTASFDVYNNAPQTAGDDASIAHSSVVCDSVIKACVPVGWWEVGGGWVVQFTRTGSPLSHAFFNPLLHVINDNLCGPCLMPILEMGGSVLLFSA